MNQYPDYLTPKLTAENLDLYLVRSAILRALKAALPHFSGILLDVGCGYMPYKSLVLSPPNRVDTYVGLDIGSDIYGKPDAAWDGNVMPFRSGAIDCAMATEVLEHCPEPEAVLAETVRVLRPGGMFFFTVPFLWPLHDMPYDEYRYTPFSLARILRNAGFGQIELQAFGGWDASLAQMIGLWVRRRPMSPRKRSFLSFLTTPLFRYLVSRDRPPDTFSESFMLTGISGTGVKPIV